MIYTYIYTYIYHVLYTHVVVLGQKLWICKNQKKRSRPNLKKSSKKQIKTGDLTSIDSVYIYIIYIYKLFEAKKMVGANEIILHAAYMFSKTYTEHLLLLCVFFAQVFR